MIVSCSPVLRRRSDGAEISAAHVRAGKAYGNSLLSCDLELDGNPVARRPGTINAATTDPFARFEIGALAEPFHEPVGIRDDRFFPFGAAPEQSKEHS
jgi:hypothetical protein